jgi:leucyl/phenylalanyl-tRNA--protein transferase
MPSSPAGSSSAGSPSAGSSLPGPCLWSFPNLRDPALERRADSLVAVGADLEPATLLQAYRTGLFPMPESPGDEMAWWSPTERGVLPLDGLRVSRSLRQAVRHVEVRVDTAFDAVLEACADPGRPGGWIDSSVTTAYVRLHALGHAHSVEAWRDDVLVGGLYGVTVGGLFAGESMFHTARDASKVALVALVEMLSDELADQRLLDVQWSTPHLASLGVVEIPRREYLRRLDVAVDLPLPAAFARST